MGRPATYGPEVRAQARALWGTMGSRKIAALIGVSHARIREWGVSEQWPGGLPQGRQRNVAQRAEARRLYTETRLLIREIAAQLGVGRRTVEKWCEAENWPRRCPAKQPPPGRSKAARGKQLRAEVVRWRCDCGRLNATAPCASCGAPYPWAA